MAARPAGMLLEVGVASVEDACAAEQNGAGRLELCSGLALGGVTPSLGLFLEVKAAVALPVIVLVRPRPGGFAYSAADYRVLCRDLDLLLAHGADGVAIGVLHPDGTIDRARCQILLRQVGPAEAVFHRAFDVTPEPGVALEELIDLGFRRVLTSGQEESAYNGAALIAALINQAAGRIEVLPAGGLNRFNLADVVRRTGCDQVHATLRFAQSDPSPSARPHISFGTKIASPEDRYDATNPKAVAALVAALKDLGTE
jgi:copper homeostasis protein